MPGEAAISQLFGRAGDLGYFLLEAGYPLDDATCIADGIYYEYTYDDLLSDDEAVRTAIDELVATCLD